MPEEYAAKLDQWGLSPRFALDKSKWNPDGYKQKNRGVMYKYILGSAFAASFVEFIIFFVITVIWFVIFDFAFEPAYPMVFPISGLYQVALFFVITFVASFFLSFEHNLYADVLRLYSRVLGGTNTLAMTFCMSLRRQDLNSEVKNYFKYTARTGPPEVSSTPLKQVYRDVNEILRAMVLAQRFEHRTSMKKQRDAALGSKLDMSNNSSELRVEWLPMGQHLINEILHYQHAPSTSGLADQMWNMVFQRLQVMSNMDPENAFFSQHLTNAMNLQLNGLSTDTAEIIANKWVGAVPIVVYFLQITTYLWCFSIAWQLWGDYGWVGLIAAVVVLWVILSLWRVGVKLADPFASWNSSRWIWADMTARSIGTAKEIDEVFDRLFERLAPVDQVEKRLRKPQLHRDDDTTSIKGHNRNLLYV